MQILNQLKKWLTIPSTFRVPQSRRSASWRQQTDQIQQLESRIVLAAPNPVSLTSLNGSNGVKLVGDHGDAGLSVDGAGDVNGDGYDDLIVGASGFQIDGNGAGAAFIVFGQPGGFADSIDLSDLNGQDGFRIDGVNWYDYFGHSVSSAGDVNGDGFDDLLIGAYEFTFDPDDREPTHGEAFVVFGKQTFSATLDATDLNGSNGFKLEGFDGGDFFGESVSSAGDLNGDGYSDVVVGAWRASGGSGRGDTFIVFGKQSGFSAVVNTSSLNGTNGFRVNGTDAGDFAGDSVSSAGDINGDGFDDLLIGVTNGDPTGASNHDHGQTFVVYGQAGSFPSTMTLSDINGTNGFRIDGVNIGDTAGEAVSNAGDVNGDGVDDIIIGAQRAEPGDNTGTGEGESYVVFGQTSGFGTTLSLGSLNGTNGFRLSGEDSGDGLGVAVGSAGDVNGDGFDDLIVGAQRAEAEGANDGTSTGESYLIFGKSSPFAANVSITELDGNNGFRIDGDVAGEQTGHSVRGAGDINGDGFDDVIVGTYGGDNSYVILGDNFTGGSETKAGDDSNNTINASQGAGPDVLIGGRGADTLISDGGPDVLRGAQGDDMLVLTDADFSSTRRVLGGNGTDTLQISGAGVDFDLTTIPDNRIVDIEVIDLVNTGSTLTLDQHEVLNISSHSNSLTVFRSTGETLNIGAGWTQEANEVVGARHFEVFTQGAATLRIHTVPMVTLAVSPSAITEEQVGNLVYTFARDATIGPLSVNFSVAGDAGFNTDYSQIGATSFGSSTGTVTFADGQATASVTLTATDDNLVEQTEGIDLLLTASDSNLYVPGSPDVVSGTITDNDSATYLIDDVAVSEGAGSIVFTVSASNPVDIPVNVQLSLASGTANGNGIDFESVTRAVSFPAGDAANKTIAISVTDDNLVEQPESFSVILSSNTALGSRSTDFSDDATGLINDNDIATFTIDDVIVHEDAGTAILTVSLDNPVDTDVEIDVEYADGTAIGAVDGTGAHYDNSTDTIVFPAGSTYDQQVSVTISDDDIITGDREFMAKLKLQSDPGARSFEATDTAVVSIVDDTAVFTISDVVVTEGDDKAVFTVLLDNPLDIAINLTVAYSDDSAVGSPGGNAADYDNNPGTLQFAAGDTTDKTIAVTIVDDGIVEASETFEVSLTSTSPIGSRTLDLTDIANATIHDNDTAGITVSSEQTNLTEDRTSESIQIVLTAEPDSNVVLATASSDQSELLVGPSELTFTPSNWDQPQIVTVTGVDDDIADGDQSVQVSITVIDEASRPEFAGFEDTLTFQNQDNDVATLTLTIAAESISESAGNATTSATISRNTDTSQPLTVSLSSSPDSEITIPQTVVVAAGSKSSAPFSITAIDDTLADGPKTVTITATADGLSEGVDSLEVTDNDRASLTLTIVDAAISENGGTTTATIARNGAVAERLSVQLTSNATDEAVVPATVSIASGQTTSEPFTITAINDGIVDGTQTVTITATAGDLIGDAKNLAVTDDDFIPGNVDGDGDFDANDSFLIHLVLLSGGDTQIDDAKGTSQLSAEEIRAIISRQTTAGDVDGDGDFDANDSFLIHLIKLSGSNDQINQAKGTSQLSADQIRANVRALEGSGATQASRSARRAISIEQRYVDELYSLGVAEEFSLPDHEINRTISGNSSNHSGYRTWIDTL